MKVTLKNLGILKQASFELGEFTIICGKNNTGKTYVTYALFGFLQTWDNLINIEIDETIVEKLLEDGVIYIDLNQYLQSYPNILKKGCQKYSQLLPKIFATSPERFKNSEFNLELEISPDYIRSLHYLNDINSVNSRLFSLMKPEESLDLIVTLLTEGSNIKIPQKIIKKIISDTLKEIIFGSLIPNPFIASAERTGTAIFRKELNFARNRLLEEISQSDKNIDPFELLFKGYDDYALPIKSNVEFTRQLETIAKKNSFIAEEHPDILQEFSDIVGGEYWVNKDDKLFFNPQAKTKINLTMDESSSAVRSLLDIGFYLKHIAQKGNLLVIDEPELNLHPENQRRIARLLTRLVNLGVKVLITTHSDYIIKELNTLIMLNQDKPYLKEICQKEGYRNEELLDATKIKVYIAEQSSILLEGKKRKALVHTLTSADISPKLGIEVKSFDTAIDTMNRIQEAIIWGAE